MPLSDDTGLRALLAGARTIAVVGHSDKPWRDSYGVAAYLCRAGYIVYPVNPSIEVVDGQRVYPGLADLPGPVDIVDVFRRPDAVPAVVEQAIAVHAPAIWLQLGVYHGGAVAAAERAGLVVVTGRCIMVEHRRLLGAR